VTVARAPSSSPVKPVWYAGSETVWGELWTMLHVAYTLMVLSFVVIGAAVSPHLSWPLLAGTLVAYALGLGVGAHLLDQVPGMGSRYVSHWPTPALWIGGLGSIAAAVALGVLASVRLHQPDLLLFVGVQGLCAIGYPLARAFRGALHRDSVFAVSWGALPFLTSYYAQSGGISVASVLLAAAFAAVAVVEIRISRISRRLRSEAREGVERTGTGSAAREAFHDPDVALQALSVGSVLIAVALVANRVMLGT
jgi:hypothetical protein